MSKKFKSQASSSRAASSLGGFGSFATSTSPLSYVAELPDLTGIPDPNVVVSFKNLSKKDSTTKAKALEELTESLKDEANPAVLTAWSQLYPRTSIDNSQKVRRLAHTLQGTLVVNATKKIVPLLPQIVPSWLAGLYDNDKSVSKAASDALERTFTTFEKRKALWTIYKDSIQERVDDALLTQTAGTLSDERTTNKDEAELKYVRVLGTALYLLSNLLQIHHDHPPVLDDKKLWDLIYHDDSWVRTGTCTVANAILAQSNDELDWSTMSTAFISKGLQKNQTGSARAFTDTLVRLTKSRPSVWTSDYTAKTAASKRLTQFLKLGSQGGPRETWALLAELLQALPTEVWNAASEDYTSIVEALRQGVSTERVAALEAWSTYTKICLWLNKAIVTETRRLDFVKDNLVPIIRVFVNKNVDENWRLGPRPDTIAKDVLKGVIQEEPSVLEDLWNVLVASTVEKMKLSLPETSKEYNSSQDTVALQSSRLAVLRGVLLDKASGPLYDVHTTIRQHDERLLHSALDLLRSRNGKPYGAAAIVEDLARQGYANDERLQRFLTEDVPNTIDSPSASRLVSVSRVCNKPIAQLLLGQAKRTSYVDEAVRQFLSNCTEDELKDPNTRALVLNRLSNRQDDSSGALSVALLSNNNLARDSLQLDALAQTVDGLLVNAEQETSLDTLESLLKQPTRPKVLEDASNQSKLTTQLLVLADGESTFAERAASINSKLASGSGPDTNNLPIIKQQLSGDAEPLSVLTLVDLAAKLSPDKNLAGLLPSEDDWVKALQPHLQPQVNENLSLTSPLHGAISLVDKIVDSKSRIPPQALVRDKEDFSLLFRLVYYVTKLVALSGSPEPSELLRDAAIVRYYPVALQLVNDKLTLDDANEIWLGSTGDLLEEASQILSQGNHFVSAWLVEDSFKQYWIETTHELQGTTPESYFTALMCFTIIEQLAAESPGKVLHEFDAEMKSVYKSEKFLQSCALVAALGPPFLASQNGTRALNELIASATSAQLDDLRHIILLNNLVNGDFSILKALPQQRLVFLLKHLLQLSADADDAAQIEIIKAMTSLIPAVTDIYGEHWEEIMQLFTSTGSERSDWTLPTLHAKLKLYAELRKALTVEDVNEDLIEVWQAEKQNSQEALLQMLQPFLTPALTHSQPRTIVAELLRRQIATIDLNAMDMAADDNMLKYVDLLRSSESAIQSAVFELLHRSIPMNQEQRSMDLVLEQKVAQLPQELLSLTADETAAPRRYLLSWKLIFDHWTNASHRLQESYTLDLKSSGHVNKLLDSLCNHLQLTSGRPINASRFDITQYTGDILETEEKDIEHLAVHVTYLALLLVPSLVKDWYLEQKNRVKSPLESWTQKYMTPLITSTTLAAVTEWTTSQSSDASEHAIEIKTSPQARELNASIPIDPESPPISLSISLPPTYPLDSPTVHSRTRVGVSEKKWESWLRTFQIIIFSSGSIIEGLIAFRRNVAGALRGQTECAICYSIIGTDMQTPSKRCGTCRNMFHGSCLFRWFRSSNSSSCPLCRNNFNYA